MSLPPARDRSPQHLDLIAVSSQVVPIHLLAALLEFQFLIDGSLNFVSDVLLRNDRRLIAEFFQHLCLSTCLLFLAVNNECLPDA